MHKLARPPAFFAEVRDITGPLDQAQVESINGIMQAAPHWPLCWVAYALATAWHESRLKPIREQGGRKYLLKYDTGWLAKMLGNTPAADGDGVTYAGRGFVQLTGKANYRKAGAFLGLDLLANPDLALVPANATRILVWGMSEGAFTGKKLASYLKGWNGAYTEFVAARRIINGTDRAEGIASLALRFQTALHHGGYV